jgi:hypothetical protein
MQWNREHHVNLSPGRGEKVKLYPQGKNPQYLFYKSLGGRRIGLDAVKKRKPPARNQTMVFPPVAHQLYRCSYGKERPISA